MDKEHHDPPQEGVLDRIARTLRLCHTSPSTCGSGRGRYGGYGAIAVTSAASRLRDALAALLIKAETPELMLVHRWLDNWHGVGLLAVGLHRIGYDLDLRQYGTVTGARRSP